jgi:hypothetical protein
MRAVFQEQADVAHVYLGSKRSLMKRLFDDQNDPFWRSAKQLDLGPIPAQAFRAHIGERFAGTGKAVEEGVITLVLETTRCHPYGSSATRCGRRRLRTGRPGGASSRWRSSESCVRRTPTSR